MVEAPKDCSRPGQLYAYCCEACQHSVQRPGPIKGGRAYGPFASHSILTGDSSQLGCKNWPWMATKSLSQFVFDLFGSTADFTGLGLLKLILKPLRAETSESFAPVWPLHFAVPNPQIALVAGIDTHRPIHSLLRLSLDGCNSDAAALFDPPPRSSLRRLFRAP